MDDALDPAALARLGDRLAAHAGLRVPDWVLSSRVKRRMDALGVAAIEAYAALLEDRSGEIERLVEELRVGETRLFRHRPAMDALAGTVVPALRATGRRSIRAWSAGCASGEEPYSLAILLRQGLPAGTAVEVLATDISQAALDVARAATYPADAVDKLAPELRSAFVDTPDGYRVADEFAGLVRFERRNLADGGFPQRLDVILCRNVLIYFEREARDRAVARMVDCLQPGGFFLVGYSETLRDADGLEPVRAPGAVLYRKRMGPAAVAAREAIAAPVPRVEHEHEHEHEHGEARVVLAGRYEGKVRLTQELGAAMAEPHRRVTVEADGAEYLDDEAAAVLRRARAAARAAGVEFRIEATRPGTLRWLRRTGLDDE